MKINIITEYTNSRKPEAFIEILKQQQVEVVIDVRYSAVRPTYFTRINLENALLNEGIDYYDFHQLGNPPAFRKNKSAEESKRLYTKFILDYRLNDITSLVKNLMMTGKRGCLICYCLTTDPSLCHRFWLLEIMEKIEKFENE